MIGLLASREPPQGGVKDGRLDFAFGSGMITRPNVLEAGLVAGD
jgi:hypothetical protein